MSSASIAAPHDREDRRVPLLVVGIVLFLGSELMFFGSLFATYFALRAQAAGGWAPPDVELDLLRVVFTSVLVGSSGTMQMAVHRIRQGELASMRRWIWITMAMGLVFLGGQAMEWADLPFTVASSAYGSTFFTLTGFHGLHVAAGLVLMLVVLSRAAHGAYSAREHAGVEVAGYYWHFVDVVWIALFLTLFVVR